MKKPLVSFWLPLISMLLVGCSTTPITIDSQTSTYTYSVEDIKYYKEANESIFINKKVEFKKQYEGYCAVALANIDGGFGPVLVGEDPVQVAYYQSSKNKYFSSAGKVEVNGKQFYYSSTDGFISGKLDNKVKYEQYVSLCTTLEDVAIDLASKATFVPVEESKKVYFQYKERDVGGYEISAGPYAQTLEDIVIPSTYRNEDVTAVADYGFKGLPRLKSLRFEGKKIKVLGKEAFHSNRSLEYALLPDSITSVGAWCFDAGNEELLVFSEAMDNTGYGYEWLGNSSSAVLERAFWEYKDYYVDGDYVYGLKVDDKIAIVRYRGEETNIVLPTEYNGKPVTIIEKFSFKARNKIVDVAFHSGIKYIGREAFDSCVRLKKAVFPEGLKEIERSAFNTCKSLEYVILPESLTRVGPWAFDVCDELTGIYCYGAEGSFTRDANWNGSSRKKPVYYKNTWYLGSDGVPHPNN